MERAGLFYYENDFKCFEGSIRPRLQRACEVELIRHLLSAYKDDAEFIVRVDTGINKLHFKNVGLHFEVTGERMSGDLWTSLFNGFHNLMTIKFIANEKGGKVKAYVEGDDGIIASTTPYTAEDFKNLGHLVDIKELISPLDGHFCGMKMAHDLTLLKDPRHVFRTFGWTGSFLQAGHTIMDSLLRSKALSLSYEMPQCPVVGELARTALRLTEGLRTLSPADWKTIPADFAGPSGEFAPSMMARAAYESKFGVSVETQILVEAAIRAYDMELVAELIPPTNWDLLYTSRYIEVA